MKPTVTTNAVAERLATALVFESHTDSEYTRLLQKLSLGVFTPEGEGIRVHAVTKTNWLELSASFAWLQAEPGKRALVVPTSVEKRARLIEVAAHEGLRMHAKLARKAEAEVA